MFGLRSANIHLLDVLRVWPAFRRTDLNRFVSEHQRLYAEADRTGDYGAVTAAYYDVMGEVIEHAYGSSWHFFPPQSKGQTATRAIAAGHEQLAARLSLERGQRGIDIGSGVGGWMRYVAQRSGSDFVGVSIGEDEVGVANREHRAAGLDGQCATIVADARDMPFEPNSFDGGSAIYALKYFPDLEAVFREIARVLKPGAVFVSYNIVRTAKLDPHDTANNDLVRRVEFSTGMPKLPTAAEMIAAAAAAGMACIEDSQLLGTGPWWHYVETNLLVRLMANRRAHRVIRALEAVRLVPAGMTRFQETFVDATVNGLIDAGRHGVLDGANVLVFRKCGERPAAPPAVAT